MKLITVIGTRPQFLKYIPLGLKLKNNKDINNILVHSGQHYDEEMSKNILQEFNINNFKYKITKQGITQIEYIGYLMCKLETIFLNEQPDKILIFGDCDTTFATMFVSKRYDIPIIHVEGGMRGFNIKQPEEVNRIMIDHISQVHLTSTHKAIENLNKENIIDNIYYIGNLQLELLDICLGFNNDENILKKYNIETDKYILLTLHRHENTNVEYLSKIFQEFKNLEYKIIYPIHPRTKNIINQNNISIPNNVILINPVVYSESVILIKNSVYVITDSGGVQPEAWHLNKKCIVLQETTAWLDEIEANNNILYNNFEIPLKKFIDDFLEIKTVSKSKDLVIPSEEIIDIILNN